ncbi:pancreatic lipase-related protein 2-like [Stegodyphus dumicola]|uniref:pancreatic lipase-related protein 2-like n=1 Tax=Stegodyphus dumicola TaxID=202533 RepID=UPI0015B1D366|nr:pancreatic lipase-related protein 2-like [Stegodyphus dumicola]XP_035215886.1 pancreatic lipase-related protein 2-like [Stegodyphus dumicola]
MSRKEVLILLCIFHIQNRRVEGDDFFMTGGARFKCFPSQIPEDCNQDFTDAYPELSRSVRNDTLADTYFYFLTSKNPDVPEPLHKCGGKLPKGTNFNPENEFKIYIQPFFINVCDTAIAREMKDQLLERADFNVMIVDDSWAMSFDAPSAIANVELIGKQVATVLQNIQDQTGIAYDKIHIITHSLGAQVAGAIGKHFKFYRITGLDPAAPSYADESLSIDRRLDPTDAEIVEVVHCDAEPCTKLGNNIRCRRLQFLYE